MVVAGTQSSNDFANDINGSTFNVQRAQEDAHPAGPVGPGLNSPRSYTLLYSDPRPSMSYCDRCERSFPHDRALEQHKEDSNSHWPCDDCDRDFSSYEARQQHYTNSGSHHYCEECDRHFRNENNLHAHMNSKAHKPQTSAVPAAAVPNLSSWPARSSSTSSRAPALGHDARTAQSLRRPRGHESLYHEPLTTAHCATRRSSHCAFQSAPEEPTRLRSTDVSSRIEESSLSGLVGCASTSGADVEGV
ncbi:hypothetical protein BJV77DRAFT_1069463 [Russula vinacea]|nr:hypothetical protein BJV77DRAFT_1069463 [Russula vinacea]